MLLGNGVVFKYIAEHDGSICASWKYMPVRKRTRKKTGPFRPTSEIAKATFGSPDALLAPFRPSQWQAPKQKPKSEELAKS